MKKIIIISAVVALFSASVAYAYTGAINVPSQAIYLKDGPLTQPILSFQDGGIKCYIVQVSDAISCVKM